MNNPLVSIQIVVYNGEKYIRHCLRAAMAQTYPNVEIIVFDNASTDRTRDIVRAEFPSVRLIQNEKNLGMWPGQEETLKHSHGEYVVGLSVDVMLHPNFVKNTVATAERDPQIGAVQAKIYQYDFGQLADGSYRDSHTIDTCGFALTRERKVINLGHGEPDGPHFNVSKDIFGVEGAVPFFRRSALEDCRMDGWIWDPDYFWYGDDLDLAWRMTLFGWRQVFAPDVIAWHDRSTTKGHATGIISAVRRHEKRAAIPLAKRRLDWSNTKFTIVKNDYILNILKDLPWILWRELMVFGYSLLFEPAVFLEAGRFFRHLPRMFRRRRDVMIRAKHSAREMHRWLA